MGQAGSHNREHQIRCCLNVHFGWPQPQEQKMQEEQEELKKKTKQLKEVAAEEEELEKWLDEENMRVVEKTRGWKIEPLGQCHQRESCSMRARMIPPAWGAFSD